jgi:uncharacterized protein (DUF2252 family)
MKRSNNIFCSVLALLLLSTPLSSFAQDRAYDIIKSQYAVYTSPNDPLAFPAKVWALQANQYAFWRGSRDLYYRWCRDNAADWLADRESYVLNHGDLHLGNIGTYVRAKELTKTDFGMVDFDDTANLPFQIELLQGLITLRLAARTGNVDLTGSKREELAAEMFAAYRIALMTDKSTRELISRERRIGKYIEDARNEPYDVTLRKFTNGQGKFKPAVETAKKKELKEILRPAMDRADDIARGIAQAINNSPEAKAVFRYNDVDTVRKSIKDVALRTRLESVGSQGLKKYLVLLEKPLKQLDMDVVMYVKQEIPAAAERAGAIDRDHRSPGRRASEDMEALTNPTAYMNSWCDIGGESYWVTFKEPWSEELDEQMVKSFDGLKEVARVWGSVAGAMHRENGDHQAIIKRLTPQMEAVIRHRSTSYMAELDRQFFDFLQDDRVKADAGKANQLIEAARLQAQARAAAR